MFVGFCCLLFCCHAPLSNGPQEKALGEQKAGVETRESQVLIQPWRCGTVNETLCYFPVCVALIATSVGSFDFVCS